MGIIGTVMGLVHMLAKLNEPGKMGPSIAAAFIATLVSLFLGIPLGYVLARDQAGSFSECAAQHDNGGSFCICNGLLSSAGYNPDTEEPLYTVGANGYRVNRIMAVKELMDELSGRPPAAG